MPCPAAKDVKGMLRFGVVDVGDSNQFSEMSTSAVIRLMFGHRQYSIPVVFGYDGVCQVPDMCWCHLISRTPICPMPVVYSAVMYLNLLCSFVHGCLR